jgi:hypothetical protein
MKAKSQEKVETCYGSPGFKRFAQDQDFIEELRSRRRRIPLYLLWLILADCGRSFSLWAGWCFVFVFSFALFYTPCPEGLPDWLKPVIPNLLCEQIQSCGAAFEQTAESYKDRPMTFDSAFYFSIVTFTTLGFGDVITANVAARVLVTLEVILGYVMLGGLISIFATKLARRS